MDLPQNAADAAAGTRTTHPMWVRIIRRLGRGAALLGAIVSAAIMLGIVADVATRQATGRSIPGMIELVETFMVIVVYLSLAHAESIGAHVRMSLLTRWLPSGWRVGVRLTGLCISLFGSAWLCWATADRALESAAVGEVRPGLLRFPVWPARIAVAVGFALLVLEFAVRIREEWSARPRGHQPRRVSTTVANLREG